MMFLGKHNILYKFQSRFQKHYSTDFCLSLLADKISKGFDSGLLSGMVSIDHIIILVRMPSLGFSREVIDR